MRLNPRDPHQRAEFAATEGAAGRFRMALLVGNFDEAQAAWRDGQAEVAQVRWRRTPWRDTPLATLGMSMKLLNLLEEKFCAVLVRDLDGLTRDEFLLCRIAGVPLWQELVDCLAAGKRRHEEENAQRAGGNDE